jgi:hypothetical protein
MYSEVFLFAVNVCASLSYFFIASTGGSYLGYLGTGTAVWVCGFGSFHLRLLARNPADTQRVHYF